MLSNHGSLSGSALGEVAFDVVPEPSSLALAGLGILPPAGIARRRREAA